MERLLKIVITTTTMALAGLAILVCGCRGYFRNALGLCWMFQWFWQGTGDMRKCGGGSESWAAAHCSSMDGKWRVDDLMLGGALPGLMPRALAASL